MERLTHRELSDLGTVYFTKCDSRDCKGHCIACDIPNEAEHKLKAYEDAEEQGLLLRLPCKVGTTVYVIVEEEYEPNSNYYCIYGEAFHPYMLESIGKDVFLTYEEAEQALKGGNNG